MDLIEFQKKSQESVLKKLDKDFQKRKYLAKAVANLSKKIAEFKKNNLVEVAAKIIKDYEKDFLEILEADLKNIEDRIAKPLTNALIDSIEFEKISYSNYLPEVQNSAKALQSVTNKTFAKLFNTFSSLMENRLKNFSKYCTNRKHESAFFIYKINSLMVSKILLIDSLKLCTVTFDEENLQNTWQNVSQSIFFSLNKALKKEFEKSKELVLDINEEHQQEIGGTFVELLIDEGYLVRSEEEKEKNYVSLRINEKFVKNLKEVIDSVVVKTIYSPMVVKPVEWRDIKGGGFLHFEDMDENFDIYLMKAETKREKQFVKNLKIPQTILEAINHLQNVGYRIDKNVLDKLNEVKKEIDKLEEDKKIDARIYLKVLFELKEEFENASVKNFKDAEIYFLKNDNLKEYIKKKFERKYKSKSKLFEIAKDLFELDNKTLRKYEIFYELAKFDNSLDTILSLAQKYKDFKSIYFVWQMDFRGRVYPVQTLLHPQGSDFVKALLVFDEEREVKNIKWFKIHGANLFGKDKVPFEERIRWVDENEDNILSVNSGSDFWMEADEPFEFYQFCLEYAKYKKDPQNFKTSLPIAVDGSNNGLQHISTMLRDKKTARRVNVLPTDRVNDVYMDVLNEFLKLLKNDSLPKKSYVKKIGDYELYFKKEIKEYKIREDLIDIISKELSTYEETIIKLKKYGLNKKENELALRILEKCKVFLPDDIEIAVAYLQKEAKKLKELGFVIIEEVEKFLPQSLNRYVSFNKFNRSFIKKPVMIDSYGAGREGKAEKIFDEVEHWFNLEKKYKEKYAMYLAELVDKAIDKITVSASLYDAYMKKAVKIILDKNPNKLIRWKTPLGLDVVQIEYKKDKGKPIKFKNAKITYVIESDKVDRKEQQKGISPNFIHSLDATHLYMTLLELKKRGIKHIRPIHDSYAVYADDMDELQDILKEKFIEIYSRDILKDFIGFVRENYEFDIKRFKKEVEKIVNKKAIVKDVSVVVDEDFDVEEIKNSKYMFS